MARRGFFAELERQARIASANQQRAQVAASRAHVAAVRAAERSHRESERLNAQMLRASEADRKRLEKEAKAAHIASMEAEVEERNLALAEIYDSIDNLLSATLEVDDFVDLETLRTPAEHPPFDRADLEQPLHTPTPIPDPPAPVLTLPEAPRGLGGIFAKKSHAEAVEFAQANHQFAMQRWRADFDATIARRASAAEEHSRAEADRLVKLEAERARYAAECAAREHEAAERGRALDELIANLGYGTVDAVQEYVAIVLSHSVYPDAFPVTHEFEFDPATAELRLRALVPGPTNVPEIRSYKFNKSTDEITSTALPQKEAKERYSRAVHAVALRSLHEVFEADRRGLIRTISLEVGTKTIDPATGREVYLPFVAVAAEREAFLGFDLAAVVPTATLAHLGAAVSKDPYKLVPADITGIRRA